MAVESRLQLQPYDTTVRYYVDGTNGLDGALGTSWATAWKTWEYVLTRVSSALCIQPSGLTILVRYRGVFANEDIAMNLSTQGNSAVIICEDISDSTLYQTGTVAAATAATEKHGITRLTLGGGITLTANDAGRLLWLSDGTNIGTCTIIEVDTVNNYAWTTRRTYPAWVTLGVEARIYDFSTTGIHNANFSSTAPYAYGNGDGNLSFIRLPLSGMVNIETSAVILGSFTCTGAVSSPIGLRSGGTLYQPYLDYFGNPSRPLLTELGYYAGADGFIDVGSNVTASTWKGILATSSYCNARGRFNKAIRAAFGGIVSCSSSFVPGVESDGEGYASLSNSMCTGQASATVRGFTKLSYVTFTVPAAGIANGLVFAQDEGYVIASNVEGTNDGAGTQLYGVRCERGGSYKGPLALKGKHGDLSVVDGVATIDSATTIGASVGGGPDIFVEDGHLRFAAGVTKSATNPSGGGTAQPVLQCRRGAKVTQAAASTFTLPAGSGDNTTDYGANGAIDIETCCDVVLGLLAGGNAIATNTAVRVKKASRLAHAGAAPTWGAAALDQGGNAAAAMPAAVTSDMAAGVPEDCWVLPGAA